MEKIYKTSLLNIKRKTFREAIYLAYKDGITSIAPLGFSGNDIIIHGSNVIGRKALISVRNYSGDPQLLITDMEGHFLCYMTLDINLGVEIVADTFYKMFKLVKDKINTVVEQKSKFQEVKVNDNCTYTEGFEMMKAYQSSLGIY